MRSLFQAFCSPLMPLRAVPLWGSVVVACPIVTQVEDYLYEIE